MTANEPLITPTISFSSDMLMLTASATIRTERTSWR